jgi:hypothetical protein
MRLGPRPTGRPWTRADDVQLLALLALKMDKALIARKLKRTITAVESRKHTLKANPPVPEPSAAPTPAKPKARKW